MQKIAHRILPILHKRQEQIAEQALQILAKYQTTQQTPQTISRQSWAMFIKHEKLMIFV